MKIRSLLNTSVPPPTPPFTKRVACGLKSANRVRCGGADSFRAGAAHLVQENLADEKQPPPLGPPYEPRHVLLSCPAVGVFLMSEAPLYVSLDILRVSEHPEDHRRDGLLVDWQIPGCPVRVVHSRRSTCHAVRGGGNLLSSHRCPLTLALSATALPGNLAGGAARVRVRRWAQQTLGATVLALEPLAWSISQPVVKMAFQSWHTHELNRTAIRSYGAGVCF